MQNFNYKALDRNGKLVSGKLIAENEDSLREMVEKKDLVFVSSSAGMGLKKATSKQLDTASLVILFRQLSSILNAGMTLVKSLEMLHSKLDKPKIKKALEGLYEAVQKGNSLSRAMEGMGAMFPTMVINMIRAGESSGEVDRTLANLADHYEKESATSKSIKSAMSYPITLLVITVLVVFAMMLFVLPKMMGDKPIEEMPAVTKEMMIITNFIKANVGAVIVVLVIAIIGIKAIFKVEKVRFAWDKFKLKVPKIGKLVRMIYTGRFARALATLYTNGVEFIEAMNMCIGVIGNRFAAKELSESVVKIQQGESISTAMSGVKSFDPLLISMIYVGEESGALDTVLVQTANYFDTESAAAIKGITSMIQPIMLCVMALGIGVVLIGIMSPMMGMYNIDEETAASFGKSILAVVKGFGGGI